MKTKLQKLLSMVFVLLCLPVLTQAQCNWQALGPNDDNVPSFGQVDSRPWPLMQVVRLM